MNCDDMLINIYCIIDYDLPNKYNTILEIINKYLEKNLNINSLQYITCNFIAKNADIREIKDVDMLDINNLKDYIIILKLKHIIHAIEL
jgi:hypothetical protein